MLQVPLSAVPNQTLSIVLDGQNCSIAVYQKQPIIDEYGVAAGLFFDLSVSGTPIVTARRCLDRTRILLDAQYLGFSGDFMFLDTLAINGGPPLFQGLPPYYMGLANTVNGGQFMLLYLEASDLASV